MPPVFKEPKTILFLFIFLISSCIYSHARKTNNVDSLIQTLPSKEDTAYVNYLLEILPEFPHNEIKEKYAKKALGLSKQFKYPEGIAHGYYQVGESYRNVEQYEKSIPFFKEALSRAIDLGDKKLTLSIYKQQAFSLRHSGNTKEAFKNLMKGLELSDELGNQLLKSKILFQIGDFHRLQHNFEEAISYFKKVQDIYANEDVDGNNCRLLFYFSITYKHFDDVEKKKEGIKSLEELLSGDCGKNSSPFNKAITLNNLGSAYVDIGDLKKGETTLLKALTLKQEIKNNHISIAFTLNELASLYLAKEEYQKGLDHAQKAFDSIEPNTDFYLEHDIARNLAHLNYKAGNYKNGYDFLEKLQSIKDTILDNEKATALAEMASKYELGVKENDILQKDLQIAQQNSQFNRYLLIGLSILGFGILLFLWSRWAFHKQKLEAKKLHELDQLKSNFFTNITHEFRTPLTVILNSFSNKNKDGETITLSAKEANIIQRNTNRLQSLINQLLDLSKLEAGKMKMQVAENNLLSFLKTLTQSFDSLAAQKNIKLQFASRLSNFNAYFDADKMEKILSNLITNAIKFTPEGGEIIVLLSSKNNQAEIVVKDNGIGISPDALPQIFNRFHQVDNSETRDFEGSGIGLALVEQMVKVHQGDIQVESTPGKGSIFSVLIPSKKSAYKADQIIELPFVKIAEKKFPLLESSIANPKSESIDSNLPILLIAEDDPDLRYLLKKQLQNQYQIIEAANGKLGLEIAINQIPDLIISDVMMPEMSGYDLCKNLKEDIRTNHIPVILLTAKATQNEKIEGLELGADSYLIKPFDKKELEVRIHNLITQRKELQNRFAKNIIYKTKETPVRSREDIFIQSLLEVIEKEIANDKFGVEELAQSIHMSRSQLYRKLKALTNKTPNAFLREIRLEKSKKLLEQGVGNVSEIAIMVGFSNANYFYKCFKDAYGKTPGEVLNSESLT